MLGVVGSLQCCLLDLAHFFNIELLFGGGMTTATNIIRVLPLKQPRQHCRILVYVALRILSKAVDEYLAI